MFKEDNSTINNNNIYAVSENTSINKVFLADRNGTTILLEKSADNWKINDKYLVRKDAIDILLNTIRDIEIQKPVPITHIEDVIKHLSTKGVKVEIYQENKLIRVYTVGGETPNQLGTYMFLQGSKEPYIMHIPGFNGYLSPRYGIQGSRINHRIWRERTIFDLNFNEINNITLNHIQDPTLSFSLNLSPIELYNSNNRIIQNNKDKRFNFISNFKKLNCEAFKEDKKWKLEKSTQLHELIVNNDTLRTFLIRESKEINKEDNFNVKRMYATLNNGDLMLIQNYVFNKVLITINELRK